MTTPLTTIEKVKLSLGITGTDKDILLTGFVTEVSAFIARLLGRDIEAVEREVIYDTPEGSTLFLDHYPLIAGAPLTVEYRTGTVGTPVWVAYTIDDYYVYPAEGMLKMVNSFRDEFRTDFQQFRVTSTGGYLIDFDNENDPLLHTLPADLTMLATEMVVARYNLKASAGINSETTEGQSINYGSLSDKAMSASQLAIISSYKRLLV